MKQYIGVKIVQAEPEQRDGKDGYVVVYEEGYKSWCPKDVFERHNREADALPFGFALEAVQQGKKVARRGWNGKGQFIFLAGDIEFNTTKYLENIQDKIDYRQTEIFPVLVLKNSNDKFYVGWTPSVGDLLHDDWFIVE
jgi:hypothetical protein